MPKNSKTGGFMNSPKGVGSFKGNPMGAPNKVPRAVGPGSNKDMAKVNKLIQQQQVRENSRGKSGM